MLLRTVAFRALPAAPLLATRALAIFAEWLLTAWRILPSKPVDFAAAAVLVRFLVTPDFLFVLFLVRSAALEVLARLAELAFFLTILAGWVVAVSVDGTVEFGPVTVVTGFVVVVAGRLGSAAKAETAVRLRAVAKAATMRFRTGLWWLFSRFILFFYLSSYFEWFICAWLMNLYDLRPDRKILGKAHHFHLPTSLNHSSRNLCNPQPLRWQT